MLQKYSRLQIIFRVLIIAIWVLVCFFVSQIILEIAVYLLVAIKVPLASINQVIINTIYAALVYVISVSLAIGAPWLLKKHKTTREEIGVIGLPTWSDILLVPAGFITYLIISVLLIMLATYMLPWFDVNQVQDVGFDHLSTRTEYILAFATLVVVVPIAEEILFRGYLFGKLKKVAPVWVAIIATSILFGYLHGAWNLAIDTFALSIILCLLRESTGSIWASILLHMTKNSVAFYFLFINPATLSILVK